MLHARAKSTASGSFVKKARIDGSVLAGHVKPSTSMHFNNLTPSPVTDVIQRAITLYADRFEKAVQVL
jgi:hypothetical protein